MSDDARQKAIQLTTTIGVVDGRVCMQFEEPVQAVFMTAEQALETAEALHRRACDLLALRIGSAMGEAARGMH